MGRKKLGEVLRERGLISTEDLTMALEEQQRKLKEAEEKGRKEAEETHAHSRECSKWLEYWQVTPVWFCATSRWPYGARKGFSFCAARESARLARLW